MSQKEFPHKAHSKIGLGLISPSQEKALKSAKPPVITPLKLQANDALKPVAMAPVTGAGEDRGIKPTPMTPTPAPAPAKPVPAQPKK